MKRIREAEDCESLPAVRLSLTYSSCVCHVSYSVLCIYNVNCCLVFCFPFYYFCNVVSCIRQTHFYTQHNFLIVLCKVQTAWVTNEECQLAWVTNEECQLHLTRGTPTYCRKG